jgi:hypothetical protein
MPQQALALANSRLTLVAARQIARELESHSPSDAHTFAKEAIERMLTRSATSDELATCVAFLDEQQKLFAAERARLQSVATSPADVDKPSGEPTLRARENLVHVLLNHHDFVTLR